jgi:hypothetical protein
VSSFFFIPVLTKLSTTYKVVKVLFSTFSLSQRFHILQGDAELSGYGIGAAESAAWRPLPCWLDNRLLMVADPMGRIEAKGGRFVFPPYI